jgi:hypothetical protein
MITVADQRASEAQVAFIARLAEEREFPDEDRERLRKKLVNGEFTKATASTTIKWLLRRELRPGYVKDRFKAMPKAETHFQNESGHWQPKHDTFGGPHDEPSCSGYPEEPVVTATPRKVREEPLPTSGVFRKDGEVYIIVASKRNPGRHYAKRMIATPDRLTSSGAVVNFDYVTDQGAIWNLYEVDRMPVAEIEALMVLHSVCIYPGCLRVLRAAKSVSAGVGKRHAEKLGIPWGKKA